VIIQDAFVINLMKLDLALRQEEGLGQKLDEPIVLKLKDVLNQLVVAPF
jgi:hypothetical protein